MGQALDFTPFDSPVQSSEFPPDGRLRQYANRTAYRMPEPAARDEDTTPGL
ncbi:hypothetical protein [Streptomyces sp. NPDC058296]|uniref:hypothetical protein n=1 Tax=Streptomyces sp. NPDC058296 TaxID=3346432 RepID=UPI0036E21E81